VNPALTGSIARTICAGSSFLFGGIARTTSGTYNNTVQTTGGCDSIITLTLTVSPIITSSATLSICEGTSYIFGTQTLITGGTYSETFRTARGCDSLVTLDLTLNLASASSISQTICEGSNYRFGSRTLIIAGTYFDTLANTLGCDSVITLELSVTPASVTPLDASICDGSSYLFGGIARTTSGTYTNRVQTASGCDSIVTLTLTVRPNRTNTITRTLCAGLGFIFANELRAQTGIYRDTVRDATLCDSITTLDLTILDTIVRPVITRTADILTATTSSAATSYRWFRNGIELINRIGQTISLTTITPSSAGNYQVLAFIGDCNSDTSAGFLVNSIATKSLSGINLYPNPVHDHLTINYNQSEKGLIQIMDATGKMLSATEIQQTEVQKELDCSSLPAGMYNIRISNANGTFQSKFVKF
jgi:hypothetical protein